MPVFRVVGDWVDAQTEDDRKSSVIRFDIILVDDQVRAKGEMLGWRGQLDSNLDLFPFVLRKDGEIDFGSTYTDDRFGSTNILGKAIREGELFNLTECGEESTYRISRVVQLD